MIARDIYNSILTVLVSYVQIHKILIEFFHKRCCDCGHISVCLTHWVGGNPPLLVFS